MKFAAVGFTCIDVYKNLNRSYATGNGVNMLFNLQDLLPEVDGAVVTAVGEDDYGEMMRAACRERGVDTTHIRTVPGGSTAVIEMLLNGRDRVHHRAERGVMPDYQPNGREMDFIRARDVIHTDLSWNVTHLLPAFRQKGARVYFDFSIRHAHPDVERILRHVDWGIFSFQEETPEVRDLLQWGCGLGCEVLLATFGKDGCLAYDGERFYREGIVPERELVNTCGAGDSFGSGFLAARLQGKGVQECLRAGAERASEIVAVFEPYLPPKSQREGAV